MTDRCAVPGCRRDVELIYLNHPICNVCWQRFAAEEVPLEKLRMVLGIEATTPTALEDRTMTEKKTETAKTAKKAKVPKAPKPKKEKPPKENLVVFACRLAEAERVAFHKATGPAGASRFARKLMIVFANGDEAGFRALLKEARESLQ